MPSARLKEGKLITLPRSDFSNMGYFPGIIFEAKIGIVRTRYSPDVVPAWITVF